MIENEKQYQYSVSLLLKAKNFLEGVKHAYEKEGLSQVEIKHLMDPLTSFYLGLEEEIKIYEELGRGR